MRERQAKQMESHRHGWLQNLLLAIALSWVCSVHASSEPATSPSDVLLVSQFKGHHLAYVDPQKGVIARVKVGRAPYGVAISQDGHAYVATAEGVAVVNNRSRLRTALIPYQSSLSGAQWGEYRQGGMGIAVSSDGKTVAVGVNRGHRAGQLEIISTQSQTVTASVPIGIRPFQVLFSNDGHEIYSIDHDSYSVTAHNLNDRSVRVFDVAPLGYGGFAKPHYAALNAEGHLLLPIQGHTLIQLNPKTGEQIQVPLSAQTHQHGVALSKDASTLFIVGTGPAGEVSGAAVLTRINLRDGRETHLPLHGDHEQIVLSDDGKIAYLTGGNSFTGGWNGISVIDLTHNKIQTIQVDEQPLGIALWKKYDM
jgi:DNA-binding beta-propeller fold protein YncE